MDSSKYPNPKAHNQSFLSHNSKGMIKFLLSFSVLSVFLSLKPFLMQLFVSYITTVDKSYMFLLCNGLLVFIAMNSGLINPPSPSMTTDQSGRLEFNDNIVSQISSAAQVISAENVVEVEENSTMIEQENVVSDANVQVIVDHEDEEAGSLVMSAEQEDDHVLSDSQEEDEEDGNGIIMIIDEDDHAAEELNKKCEDFIKKMKAAFCSEPRADYTSYLDNEKSLVLAY